MVGQAREICQRSYHTRLSGNRKEIEDPLREGSCSEGKKTARKITQTDQDPAAELKLEDLEIKHQRRCTIRTKFLKVTTNQGLVKGQEDHR